MTSGAGATLAVYLDEAVGSGRAGPEQVEVLERSVADGTVQYEDLAELTRLTFDCFTEAGIDYIENEPTELGVGLPLPSYSWAAEMPGKTLDEVQAMGDACIDRYSYWAAAAYQDDAVVGAARDARMRRDLPQVLACLEENGVEVPTDATLDEIRRHVEELVVATETVVCYDDFIWW
ncbi:hypothetical protein [Cellulomonas sp. S1-8]|uniref:hypothetical protein n=1 Tax=Cellulomonas sp. S1-8 TaxID=2904790 RepID=UPI00224407AA|nr:hypothetical protein [Cellulomonas sp. S1-8]UZN04079.1 hypothetical protein OKX07_03855 [Cellulomonas sp. S1-8]